MQDTKKENEIWFMERILSYTKAQGYTKYTSTLIEAWRVSIAGLSDAITDAYELYRDKLPEFLPDERFEDDPVAQFGITEARLHRKRGTNLSMFLGLFKYYHYTFQDLVQTLDLSPQGSHGGVPKQVRDSFFEKYATWGKKSGTGLGTYSARLIIETIGGTISMSSDGRRTEVSVRMLLAE